MYELFIYLLTLTALSGIIYVIINHTGVVKMNKFNEIRAAADKRILLAAHRGVSGGNIPCNTIASFEIALRQGADIMELDVQRSADGQLYVFHEGKEEPHLYATRQSGEA
jgi:glycerophosphoryl diester phosphodiesterase